jgi:nucleoside-diphosphate kinase
MFSISGPIVAMVWSGNIKAARNLIGATQPWQAETGTIRGDYACATPQNLVHCSDSLDSAHREINLWGPYLI